MVEFFIFPDIQAGVIFSNIIHQERYIFFSVVIFSPGISLQGFFFLEISQQDIFFSEITHTTPQKSNGRPLSVSRITR